jgi:hypothetical protein
LRPDLRHHLDIGAMRDMHRHRRCTQIFQDYTATEWAVPEGVKLPVEFKYAMYRAQTNFEIMPQRSLEQTPEVLDSLRLNFSVYVSMGVIDDHILRSLEH